MQILPNAKSQFIDANGLPLASGTVGFYSPGTLNPKPTYQDAAGTIANTNPVQLDSRGQALIWGSGVYRQIVQDASGVTIWDQVTEDSNAGLSGNLTDAKFVSGTDFTPGTTTQLTLPANPGTISNMWVFFDAAFQADDQIASLVGTTLTFTNPIPVGVSEVNVKIGNTVSVGTPGNGSVTDASVSSSSDLYNRIFDDIFITDYGRPVTTATFAAAVASVQGLGGGLIYMGRNSAVAPPSDYHSVLLEYDGPNVPITVFGESPGALYISQKVFRYQDNSAHAGHGHSAVHIESKPIGTGAIGPTNADFGLTVSLLKQGFNGGSALAGELDGMYIAVRNDGTNSDTTAALFDVANYGAGFNALFEGNTSYITGGSVTQAVNNQAGVVDSRTNNQYGYVVQKTTGIGGVAYLAAQGAGQWQHLLQFSGGGAVRFDMPIDSNNVVTMRMVDASLNSKTIRVNNNNLSVLNNGSTVEIFSLSDTGTLTVTGLFTGVGVFAGTPGAGTAGALSIGNSSSATATAGSQTLPSNPAGFLNAFIGTTAIRLPYYLP